MATLNIPNSFTNGYVANANEVNANFQSVKTFAETQVLQSDTKTVFLAPVGSITMYTGASAPAGWLLCDGVTSTAPYPALATLVGATTPNLQSRFPIGMGALAVKNTGGSATITQANLPSHSHSITHDHAAFTSADDYPTHDHGYTVAAIGSNPLINAADTSTNYAYTTTDAITGGARQPHAHSINVPEFSGNSGPVGSGTAYYPPYYVVNFIIKHD